MELATRTPGRFAQWPAGASGRMLGLSVKAGRTLLRQIEGFPPLVTSGLTRSVPGVRVACSTSYRLLRWFCANGFWATQWCGSKRFWPDPFQKGFRGEQAWLIGLLSSLRIPTSFPKNPKKSANRPAPSKSSPTKESSNASPCPQTPSSTAPPPTGISKYSKGNIATGIFCSYYWRARRTPRGGAFVQMSHPQPVRGNLGWEVL